MSAILAPEPATEKKFVADDLLTMPDGDRYELVDGKLVEQKMGAASAFLAGKIFAALNAHNDLHKQGWVFPDGTGFDCFGDDDDDVRKPDVSFVSKGRLPGRIVPEGFISIAPDLAIEVLSPTDISSQVDEKVEDYLDHGVKVVWVVHPSLKMIRVHRLEGPDAQLRGDAILEEPQLLPGFRLSLKELFASLQAV